MNRNNLIKEALHLIERESEFRFDDIESELYEMGEHKKEEIEYILDTIYKLLGGKYYMYSLDRDSIK
ncbi:MAG: hypothetical protein Q8N78_03085 [Sulfurimonas sp.]|nr:hypothetical protein [Sulfurimonas sp.]